MEPKQSKILEYKVYTQLVFSKTAKGRYSNYIIKKILYTRILNRIKIIKLSKELLSMAYRGKEKNILLTRI